MANGIHDRQAIIAMLPRFKHRKSQRIEGVGIAATTVEDDAAIGPLANE